MVVRSDIYIATLIVSPKKFSNFTCVIVIVNLYRAPPFYRSYQRSSNATINEVEVRNKKELYQQANSCCWITSIPHWRMTNCRKYYNMAGFYSCRITFEAAKTLAIFFSNNKSFCLLLWHFGEFAIAGLAFLWLGPVSTTQLWRGLKFAVTVSS